MKPRILYVEDEPFLAKVVSETLEHQGFEVALVSDGSGALAIFDQFNPDVCILDVMLPNVDGFSLGKIIRARDARIPLIYLTARSFTEDVLTGFESGASDYIRKPFSVEELIVRIHNQLRLINLQPDNIPQQQSLQIGKFSFSPDKLELAGSTHTVKLSHRETQVLSLLTNRLNQTTDRREILLAVWGDDSFFNSRTLDVYIRKLRSYFASDSQVEIITLKGKGYIFRVNS